jgi:hypothetical protein
VVARVLEEVLPERFGGEASDYQVVEQVTSDGSSRTWLYASPRLGPLDEVALRRVALDELGRDGSVEAAMARFWRRADALQVKREAPLATWAGKVLPLHLDQRRTS